MTDFARQKKKLWAQYDKLLRKTHKTDFDSPNNPLEYFITYLKYMRDYYILAGRYGKGHPDNVKVNALANAIEAYDASQTCIEKYFVLKDNKVIPIAQGTPEEVSAAYARERGIHWGTFWQLVMLNIEDWLPKDASV